jgi:hypothetical protein
MQCLTSTRTSGGYPLVPGVRDIFNTDLDQFNRVARVWTRQYAGYKPLVLVMGLSVHQLTPLLMVAGETRLVGRLTK